MTTSACATGATVSYYVGGSGALVTFNSYTNNGMSLGLSQNAFGPLPSQAPPQGTGGPLGPATTVNATFFAQVVTQYGGSLPGVLALN
jgi:hypothetical protein